MTSNEIINRYKESLETMIAVWHIDATCKESETTVSFYVYKNGDTTHPMKILRITNHRPDLQKYIRSDAPLPSPISHTNLSIEFWEESSNNRRDRFRNKVQIPKWLEDDVEPFSFDSFKYKATELNEDDVFDIYHAIENWLYKKRASRYVDPLANTSKAAIYATKTSNISVKDELTQYDLESKADSYENKKTKHDKLNKWDNQAERNYYKKYLSENHSDDINEKYKQIYDDLMNDISRIVKDMINENF